jgi:hypothetical protein
MAGCRVILDFWLRIEDPIESEIPARQSEITRQSATTNHQFSEATAE